jgi:aspartyl-tRNA(Asn)/glutamyl-tRNA(Gln) amidotransferase subunit C
VNDPANMAGLFFMSISKQDVAKVALLARLQLTDAELATITNELAQIVGYVDQLAEVNTDGVEPMAHAIEMVNVFRPDCATASLPREEALANAPHHDERGYLVPAVLGE